jgi:hypothetical protein
MIDEEEVAKEALQRLGFTVVPAADLEFAGWAVAPNGDGWGVWELHRHRTDRRLTMMSMSGRLDTNEQAAAWLYQHVVAETEEGAR